MSWTSALWDRIKRSWSLSSRTGVAKDWRARLGLELLEDRVLPAWTAIGPAPELDPQALVARGDPITGRVSALVFSQDNAFQDVLLLGAAGGGVWASTNFTNASPTWSLTNTDTRGLNTLEAINGRFAGLIDTGTLAVDPNNRKVVYLGTGESVLRTSARILSHRSRPLMPARQDTTSLQR